MMPTAITPVIKKAPENIHVCARYVGCLTIEKGPVVTKRFFAFVIISGTPIIPQRPSRRAVQI